MKDDISTTSDEVHGLSNAAKEKVQHHFIYVVKTRWINTNTETMWHCVTACSIVLLLSFLSIMPFKPQLFNQFRETSPAHITNLYVYQGDRKRYSKGERTLGNC